MQSPSNAKPTPPIRTRLMSFRAALSGLGYALRTQPNARIHLVATIIVIAMGLWLGLTRWDWCAIALAIGLVWTCELLNTALEALVDLVSPGTHPLAKVAKDVAAAAVLASALTALVVGLLILGPPLWARLGLAAGST